MLSAAVLPRMSYIPESVFAEMNRIELYDMDGKLLEQHVVSEPPCVVRLGDKKRLAKGTYVVVAGNEAKRLSFRVMMTD